MRERISASARLDADFAPTDRPYDSSAAVTPGLSTAGRVRCGAI